MTVTWDSDRPEGEWIGLGGTFPADALPTCPTCGEAEGAFCWVSIWKDPPAAAWAGLHGWDGPQPDMQFPSIHPTRWDLYRRVESQLSMF